MVDEIKETAIIPSADKLAGLKDKLGRVMTAIKPIIPELYEAEVWKEGDGVLLIKVTQTIEIENVWDTDPALVLPELLFSSWWEDLSDEQIAKSSTQFDDILNRLKTRKVKQKEND